MLLGQQKTFYRRYAAAVVIKELIMTIITPFLSFLIFGSFEFLTPSVPTHYNRDGVNGF